MSAPTMRTTMLLTEHLGYPPISLIDDIINAVNEIMYKCTQAMEKYLLERSTVDRKDYTEELRVGIAKLETLWENSVDRSFDKLELYVLRNVLHVPKELIESGSFRLKHQEELILQDTSHTNALLREIEVKREIFADAVAKSIALRRQIKEAKKLQRQLAKLAKFVQKALALKDSNDTELVSIFNSLKPMDQSLQLLFAQMRSLYLESEETCSRERIQNVIADHESIQGDYQSRASYLSSRSQEILNSIAPEQKPDSDEEIIRPLKTSTTAGQAPEPAQEPNIDHPDLSAMAQTLV
ncbi:LAMI_0F06018g1_1 [Lachancea mirantina]|uniref:LAMI_0F06018g1_1 n=1 Tax=Lachancea mirantina TaxID=1230905 RepID=A0A1G4JYW3_9SACH|nr:LAMI_0F06018g1_1 [Lachancea mirantina]